MSGRPGSRCSALGSHAFAARAGHHLAPQPLASGRNVFEELGDGFTLLSLGGDDAICGAFETAAERMRIPLTVIADSRRGGRERYDAAYILVRPDQFVAAESPFQLRLRSRRDASFGRAAHSSTG